MIVSFVNFLPGSGGNFLSRILTLCTSTFPLGPIGHYTPLTTLERFHQYTYNNCNFFSQTNKLNWFEFERLNAYPFSRLGLEQLVELDLKIIQFCHPQYFDQELSLITETPSHFIIDPESAEEWVAWQRRYKVGAMNNPLSQIINKIEQEKQNLYFIQKKYQAHAIKLKKIIGTDTEFISEYHSICNLLEITAHDTLAIDLRKQWFTTWHPFTRST